MIKRKYKTLLAKSKYLTDVVVVAQAWKKTHAFVRYNNWYVDLLSLDASVFELEERLENWTKRLASTKFRTVDLKIVPAPKAAMWEFINSETASSWPIDVSLETDLPAVGKKPRFGDWIPKKEDDEEKFKLRPLAQVSIRDQTLATTLMMCLAEAVETAQGDPGWDNLEDNKRFGMVSYGNRLQCRWNVAASGARIASFSWGNGRSYRKYFQDYRSFLARPKQVCKAAAANVASGHELFVVALDIKSFFDKVDVDSLLGELKKLEEEHRVALKKPKRYAPDDQFWKMATQILSWRWSSKSRSKAELIQELGSDELELGLPQGLMAAGFLANAYMVGFDRGMHNLVINDSENDNKIRIIDYCRYVDDIRVVVEAPRDNPLFILDFVKKLFNRSLSSHCQAIGAKKLLELSSKKCTIVSYRDISTENNMSATMEMLNAEISGTFDLESLIQAAGGLDGLLWMTDKSDQSREATRSRLTLASIIMPNTDVRDDTVKRFVATRLVNAMREKLALTDLDEVLDSRNVIASSVTNGVILAHEFELAARKLIKCWADNPSLVLLLRCGLDLYPHPKLLAPVIEALLCKLPDIEENNVEKRKQTCVAQFVAADLFRAGAVETGFRSAEEYPQGVDVQGYREELASFARAIISSKIRPPWFLLHQASFFLASIGDFSLLSSLRGKKIISATSRYMYLLQSLNYELPMPDDLPKFLPVALIAQQMFPNSRRFGSWFADGMNNLADAELCQRLASSVALQCPELMLAALRSRAARSASWRSYVPAGMLATTRTASASSTVYSSRGKRLLLSLIRENDNVFSQENALLLLARALLQVSEIEERLANGLDAGSIEIDCVDWKSINSLPASEQFLLVAIRREGSDAATGLYGRPDWVIKERAWLYGLGRILRSALTGEYDFTTRRYLLSESPCRYSGLRSSWAKRRFGLLNSSRGLLHEATPISPWLSGFLSFLLQWPGVDFRADDLAQYEKVRSPNDLAKIVEKRISEQRALFGARSGTPMYVIPADDNVALENRPVRVAVVQPMRPRLNEFNTQDLTHWTQSALSQHRRHLAEVCRLTYQKLKTWASAKKSRDVKGTTDSVVDIIVFPELAIHPEHVFILRRLSDKLKANIFCGLTYIFSEKMKGPINQGLWIVRNESPEHGRSFQYIWQGKLHPMKLEQTLGVKSYRPHLTLLELSIGAVSKTRVAAAICYDATDLDLVADLRDRSDIFIVAALNKDVQTFDNMVAALQFHMYQPVILANCGEFGGSTAQAPFHSHDRFIAHVHGGNQVAVSILEVDPTPFKSTSVVRPSKEMKSPPAGYKGRG